MVKSSAESHFNLSLIKAGGGGGHKYSVHAQTTTPEDKGGTAKAE